MSKQLALQFSGRYPRRAGYQLTDTSKAAAEKLNRGGREEGMREVVFAAYADGAELTADEAAARLGLETTQVRPRCTQLKKLGLLIDTGKRRENKSGNSTAVLRKA